MADFAMVELDGRSHKPKYLVRMSRKGMDYLGNVL